MEVTGAPRSLVYRIRVSLQGIQPEIWRLLDVSGDLTLAQLHEVIQLAFGWRLGRSHLFIEGDGRRWSDGRWYGEGGSGGDEHRTTLAHALTPQSGWLVYRYDPRAGWEHVIDLVAISAADPEQPVAQLLRGARRGPLEDVGGPQGYAELLSDLADLAKPGYASALAWVDGILGPWHHSFDPERLDVASVNRALTVRFATEGSPDHGWSPELVSLHARMFSGLQHEFADFLGPAELDQPVTIAPEVAARMVVPITRLLGAPVTPPKPGSAPPGGSSDPRDIPVPDLVPGLVRRGLIRKRLGRPAPTPTGHQLQFDPLGLWWHLARTWVPTRRATGAGDASALLLVELAVGAHVSAHEVADSVAYGLDSLGWIDPVSGSSIYEDLVWSLAAEDLLLLQALGLVQRTSLDEPLAASPHTRTFARAALQSLGGPEVAGTRSVTPARWRRRPVAFDG